MTTDFERSCKEKVKIPFEWECIYEPEMRTTERAKVIGGWIVKHCEGGEFGDPVSLVFIPDPFHTWEV
jgi:hypothetical protein